MTAATNNATREAAPDAAEATAPGDGVGASRPRIEDARFIQGRGQFIDDIRRPGMLFGAFVRSPHASARISAIDATAARAAPGVKAVLTAEDLAPLGMNELPAPRGDARPVLADGETTFEGQEVAFIVAQDRYLAADAAALVRVRYEPRPAHLDALQSAASTEATDGSSAIDYVWERGDKLAVSAGLAGADMVATETIHLGRRGPGPLEGNGCVALHDAANGRLTLHGAFEGPHLVRRHVATLLGVEDSAVQVVTPDIGGGFGAKLGLAPGVLCAAAAARLLEAPVKWIEDEAAPTPSGDIWFKGRIGATRDGKIVALDCEAILDIGAFDMAAATPAFPAGFLHGCTGAYDIPAAALTVRGVRTNGAPSRLASRAVFRVAEAAFFIERLVDILAQKLDMDPTELRAKNFIKKWRFPYASPLGWSLDSGDYEPALRIAMERVSYHDLRAAQAERVARFRQGETRRLLGVGVATAVGSDGAGPMAGGEIFGVGLAESCALQVRPTDGTSAEAIARLSAGGLGRGSATMLAQILSEEVGLPVERIEIEFDDTDAASPGLGPFGARSMAAAGAAALAGRSLRAKAQLIAAHLLDAPFDDVAFQGDGFALTSDPERFQSMTDIAAAAHATRIPGVDPGLEARSSYAPTAPASPFGAFICAVEIDVDTGVIDIQRFAAVTDCGTPINPMLIEGQTHGGLTEAAITMLGAASGGDLAPFGETPHWEVATTVTPAPQHPLGAKSAGAIAAIGGAPAIANAVIDAFKPFGLFHAPPPYDHRSVWRLAQRLDLHAAWMAQEGQTG